MTIKDEEHEWSADDLGRIVRDMFAERLERYFNAEDQAWEEARLRTLKRQGKLIDGEVIEDQPEIER